MLILGMHNVEFGVQEVALLCYFVKELFILLSFTRGKLSTNEI